MPFERGHNVQRGLSAYIFGHERSIACAKWRFEDTSMFPERPRQHGNELSALIKKKMVKFESTLRVIVEKFLAMEYRAVHRGGDKGVPILFMEQRIVLNDADAGGPDFGESG